MDYKCYICNAEAKHYMDINYVVICYCDKCMDKYRNATRDIIREFLSGRGFEETEERGGKHVDFVNRNIKIYFRPHIKKWRFRDSTQFNDLDITDLIFDFKTFEMSESEKKNIDELIIQRLK